MSNGVGAYSLGVDLGTTFVAAAVGRGSRVEMFTLGDRTGVTPAMVYARDDGTPLVVSDPGAEPLAARLRQAADDSAAVQAALAYPPVFGSEPWPPAFAARIAAHLSTLRQGGMRALLAA